MVAGRKVRRKGVICIRGGRHGCAALRTKGHKGLKGLAASAAWGTVFGHNLEQLDTTSF